MARSFPPHRARHVVRASSSCRNSKAEANRVHPRDPEVDEQCRELPDDEGELDQLKTQRMAEAQVSCEAAAVHFSMIDHVIMMKMTLIRRHSSQHSLGRYVLCSA